MYALKQSGRNWNHVLYCFSLENDFVQSPVDNCVYIKQDDSGLVVMLVWVDDIMLVSEAKRMLKERFHMKDPGRLAYFFVEMRTRRATPERCLRDLRCLIVSQSLHLLSKNLSLVMKPLVILGDTVKQWAAWYTL